jgi:hypothetical protein
VCVCVCVVQGGFFFTGRGGRQEHSDPYVPPSRSRNGCAGVQAHGQTFYREE